MPGLGPTELLIIAAIIVIALVVFRVKRSVTERAPGGEAPPDRKALSPHARQALFMKFAALPDSEREAFLVRHLEIVNSSTLDWALATARMQETRVTVRMAEAVLYAARRLEDLQRQAAAHQILAETYQASLGN